MTRLSSLEIMALLFGMMLLAGIGALMLLGQAVDATVPVVHQASINWLRPGQVHIPRDLAINSHAAKHHGDAERIYNLLLEGQCAGVAKYCGGSNIENLYICTDPVTGVVGAILQFGGEITTGYYERSGSGHWAGRTVRENWRVCADD